MKCLQKREIRYTTISAKILPPAMCSDQPLHQDHLYA